MIMKITGKEEALKRIEKAMTLIEEAEKLLYSVPKSIGLEVESETENEE